MEIPSFPDFTSNEYIENISKVPRLINSLIFVASSYHGNTFNYYMSLQDSLGWIVDVGVLAPVILKACKKKPVMLSAAKHLRSKATLYRYMRPFPCLNGR
jgi:hypothetical protein